MVGNPLMSIQYITFCKVCTLEKILAGLTPFDLALVRRVCQKFILELLVMCPNAIVVEQFYIFLGKYPDTISQVLPIHSAEANLA
jgi:hypothetical protein